MIPGLGLFYGGMVRRKNVFHGFVAFQLMFAAITLAIVISAVAERIKLSAFIVFGVLWTTLVYDPITHWGLG